MIPFKDAATTLPDLDFIAQHLFTAVLWVDESLQITWLNMQAEQLLAISRARLLNQSILTLLEPVDQNDATVEENLNRNSTTQTIPKSGSLKERFAHARLYQQPFIDHDYSIHPQALGSSSKSVAILVDYSVTPVTQQQQSYYIIEMWGKDRQSRISKEQQQEQQYDVARHMLRSVAHEVKNPLAGIRGAAQLLQRQFEKLNLITYQTTDQTTVQATLQSPLEHRATTEKMLTYTNIIISETDRLTQLIGQLLGSNQLPNWQRLNVHQIIEQVLTLVMSQYSQIALQRDYDLSLPEIEADKDQLIQVFLNLFNNACESMLEHQQALVSNTVINDKSMTNRNNKRIDYSQKQQSDEANYKPTLFIQTRIAFQHTIGSQQHKQVLQVIITDNGSGIDPALIGQIFFPMVTSRATGTGLGLSIVQDIVSRHHGRIEVSATNKMPNNQSSNNQDSCQNNNQTSFTLYLPFNQPALA